jgi:RNA polymerase sigma-70 factor (ECF subfamily)
LERGAEVQDEKVIAWFYRVLRNAVIDHYRHRSTSARGFENLGQRIQREPGTRCGAAAGDLPLCFRLTRRSETRIPRCAARDRSR